MNIVKTGEIIANPCSYSGGRWVKVDDNLIDHLGMYLDIILEGYSINAQILSRQTIRELNTQFRQKLAKELKQ